jgi:hypothetical protein
MMRLVLGEPVLVRSVLHEPLTESFGTHHSAVGATSMSTEMNALPGCESAIDQRLEVDGGKRICSCARIRWVRRSDRSLSWRSKLIRQLLFFMTVRASDDCPAS